ncbi:DUF4148 domain-containing protein [Burkholderia gladioli]|uniref:DUF4148 domain-containing protein n=1 Tax=Burkholderia gladioli TaxID=28095 RepID=UPI0038B37DC6
MKTTSWLVIFLGLGAVSAPSFSFAQASASITREQVRAELIKAEENGFNPAGDELDYPDNILQAEARAAAKERKTREPTTKPSALGCDYLGHTGLPSGLPRAH